MNDKILFSHTSTTNVRKQKEAKRKIKFEKFNSCSIERKDSFIIHHPEFILHLHKKRSMPNVSYFYLGLKKRSYIKVSGKYTYTHKKRQRRQLLISLIKYVKLIDIEQDFNRFLLFLQRKKKLTS